MAMQSIIGVRYLSREIRRLERRNIEITALQHEAARERAEMLLAEHRAEREADDLLQRLRHREKRS